MENSFWYSFVAPMIALVSMLFFTARAIMGVTNYFDDLKERIISIQKKILK